MARDLADMEIENIFSEARAGRGEQQPEPQQQPIPPTSFDGGVRAGIRNGRPVPRRRPGPGTWQETPGELFVRAMRASQARAQQDVRVPAGRE